MLVCMLAVSVLLFAKFACAIRVVLFLCVFAYMHISSEQHPQTRTWTWSQAL
jgi:hypothetical protein